MKTLTPYLFIGFIAIAMILTACKKDESSDPPTPTAPIPTEVQNYTGSTAGSLMPVTLSTGNVNGKPMLLGYDIALKYALGGVTLYEDNFAYSSPSGITEIVNNEFQYNNGDGLVLKAGLEEDGNSIVGMYDWNYVESLVYSGAFTTFVQ